MTQAEKQHCFLAGVIIKKIKGEVCVTMGLDMVEKEKQDKGDREKGRRQGYLS